MKLLRTRIGRDETDAILEGNTVYTCESLKDPKKGNPLGLLESLTLLAPCRPTKVVCAAKNHRDIPDASRDNPSLFLKPPSSVIGPGENIIIPGVSSEVVYEAELGAVIGERIKNVGAETAAKHILGYVCVNDVTARDIARNDWLPARSKGFDTFCPVGPVIEMSLDPSNVKIQCRVNGEIMQSFSSSEFLFSIYHLVGYASRIMTLEPGDLVISGSDPTLHPIRPGDTVEVEIEGIGVLKNPVVAEVRERDVSPQE